MAKVVKFKDETYGLRRFTLVGYQFRDLEACNVNYWWYPGSEYYNRCCKGSLEDIKKILRLDKERKNKKYDRGEIIKI